MPATIQDQTIYLSTGDPETYFGQTSLYKPGELGKKFTHTNGKRYQIVQVDSTASVAAIANGLLFWTNRALYKVSGASNDAAVTGKANAVAGRSPGASAVGTYLAMQIGGPASVVFTGTAAVQGDLLVAKIASAAADAIAVAIASAPTINQIPLGTATAASGGGLCACDMYLDSGGVN